MSSQSPRRRVLVIDDNQQAAESLTLILQLWGHDARSAANGSEALLIARDFAPAIALVDINLPGMDGYEVGRRLRAMPEASGAMLIAITGYGRDEIAGRANRDVFDLHLVKPVDLDDLERLLAPPERATDSPP
jgi:CheY-like chemotaxis protein